MFIIGEIGQAHEGSLGIAHSYIDALKDTGINAIKFQTHIAEAESSEFEPFRIKFSYEDDTRFDYWKRMEFSLPQWKELKNHCDDAGLEFISSPFSNAAVDLLEELDVKRYKIGSGEVSNFLLLERIAKTGKPIILSSGMSSFEEIEQAVNFLTPYKNELSILQCTTAYPTQPKEWGLNVINELKSRFGYPVGFSDHSGEIYAGLAAATLGIDILEFHVVFNKKMFGPDAKASLTLSQVSMLVEGIKQIEEAVNVKIDKDFTEKYTELKSIFEKSLAVNKHLEIGHILRSEDLEAKKPKGYGIPANQYKDVLGKRIVRQMNKWDFLNPHDLEQDGR
ncbi:MAG: N-acetylneuraminate synthase family protein [Bacteroidota bacterium]